MNQFPDKKLIIPTFVSIVVLVIWGILFFANDESFYIAGPLFSCVLVIGWLSYGLSRKDAGAPFFDIGFICALATFVYSIVPLIEFWITGLRFGPLSDGRLAFYDLTPLEMGIFHWRQVLYLSTFAVSYFLFRDRMCLETGDVELPGKTGKYVLIGIFCVLGIYFTLFELLSGFKFNIAYNSDDFDKNVALISSIPLLAIQISFKLYLVFSVVKIAILWMVMQKYRSRAWRIILWIWIAYELIFTLQLGGARTGMALFLLATAMTYHRIVAPISVRFAIPAGALLLAIFTILGILRSQTNIFEILEITSGVDGGVPPIGGEFTSLFGTTYDVYKRVTTGATEIPWYLYLNDIIQILPPQQIMPFEKISASEWYLQEIGLSGTGFGYMWGVITQSIIGLGWIEIAFRGGFLGFVLAKIHGWYGRRRKRFLVNIIYIYLCLKMYYTFRDTTGAILSLIIWEIIPFYIFLWFGIRIFSFSRNKTNGLDTTIFDRPSR